MWFAREAASSEDPVEQDKRSDDNGAVFLNRDASANKKRKIRASKQTDVTSLLGSLGHT
jgi:hypothetical protein